MSKEKEKELALLKEELKENLENLKELSGSLKGMLNINNSADYLKVKYLIKIDNDLKQLTRANMGIEGWLEKIAGCLGYLSTEESDKIMNSVLRER